MFGSPSRAHGMKNFPLASAVEGDVAQYSCVSAPYDGGHIVQVYVQRVSYLPLNAMMGERTSTVFRHPDICLRTSVRIFPGWRLVDTILSPYRRASSRATTTLPCNEVSTQHISRLEVMLHAQIYSCCTIQTRYTLSAQDHPSWH